MADKATHKKVTVYVAVDAFEFDGEEYKPGDEVALPGYRRDPAFDELRASAKQTPKGLTFAKDGPVIDKKTGDRNTFRYTLPVKEA